MIEAAVEIGLFDSSDVSSVSSNSWVPTCSFKYPKYVMPGGPCPGWYEWVICGASVVGGLASLVQEA